MKPEAVLILIPIATALVVFIVNSRWLDTMALPVTALSLIPVILKIRPQRCGEEQFLGIDDLSYLFLLILFILFCGSAIYNINFIRLLRSQSNGHPLLYKRIYVPLILYFFASMLGVIASNRLPLTWIFIEASTITSAPLIYYHKDERSLEAVWKYIFICSIGIALAFVGVISMIEAARDLQSANLSVDYLARNSENLLKPWIIISFVFALIGFGVKMGLAPMHTWLPDAHSEAPAPVSALLSGALLNCAYLVIIRYYKIIMGTGIAGFASTLLIIFGFMSIFVCAVYCVRANNLKRMLAYSSIEHMGILAIGTGLGGPAIYAAMLHTVCHSLAKHSLFHVAGNLQRAFKTVEIDGIHLGISTLPKTAVLLSLLVFVLLGFPPSGMFISEFILLKAMVLHRHWLIIAAFAILLTIIAYAFLKAAVAILYSVDSSDNSMTVQSESCLDVISPGIFLIILIALGIYIPGWFDSILRNAAAVLSSG